MNPVVTRLTNRLDVINQEGITTGLDLLDMMHKL